MKSDEGPLIALDSCLDFPCRKSQAARSECHENWQKRKHLKTARERTSYVRYLQLKGGGGVGQKSAGGVPARRDITFHQRSLTEIRHQADLLRVGQDIGVGQAE